MGKLVPFMAAATESDSMASIGPPPADAIAGASWLNHLLRIELYAVHRDPALSPEQRRAEILRLARSINASLPVHEINQAREQLAEDREQLAGKTLHGEVTRASSSPAPTLRAAGPRKRGT